MVVAAPALSTAAKRVLVLGWFGSTPSAMRPIADMCASAQGPEPVGSWGTQPLGDRLPQVLAARL